MTLAVKRLGSEGFSAFSLIIAVELAQADSVAHTWVVSEIGGKGEICFFSFVLDLGTKSIGYVRFIFHDDALLESYCIQVAYPSEWYGTAKGPKYSLPALKK